MNEIDYWNTGIYFHDTIQSRDISLYSVSEGHVESGNHITMAVAADRRSSFWRENWFPSITNWQIVQRYVALDLRDHLVFFG